MISEKKTPMTVKTDTTTHRMFGAACKAKGVSIEESIGDHMRSVIREGQAIFASHDNNAEAQR